MRGAPALPLRQEFLARLDAARDAARLLIGGARPRTAPSGMPTEFQGHRPYLPGDDTRWIDWNIYARAEELFVKVFDTEVETEVALLLDSSSSMTGGDGLKYGVAAAAAAALSYLALGFGAGVSVVRYTDRAVAVSGPFRQLEGYGAICRFLMQERREGGGTDLRATLAPLLSRSYRPLLAIALTDGLQSRPLPAAAALAAASKRCRLLVFRIDDRRDRRPRLRGTVRVHDVEGGGSCVLVVDRALERELHEGLGRRLSRLREDLERLGAGVQELAVEEPFEPAFLELLRRAAAREGLRGR